MHDGGKVEDGAIDEEGVAVCDVGSSVVADAEERKKYPTALDFVLYHYK